MSEPNLTDFEAISAAAKDEAAKLEQVPEQSLEQSPGTSSQPAAANAMPNLEDIKKFISNVNIGDVVNKISTDPDHLNKVIETSMSKMTPEMMEQAKKMASSGQGHQIMKEMQRRGLDPHAMRTQLQQHQKALKGLSHKDAGDLKQVILITNTRQIKTRQIPIKSVDSAVKAIIKASEVREIPCSRMVLGPLVGKTIKAWYDSARPGKNKLATKIVGFPVAGELILVMEEGDLTEADFKAVLELLA